MDNYDFCAQFVERLASPDRPLIVLDYGTGRATIVSRLRARGIAAFGCDVFYGGESWRSDVPPEYLAEGIIRDMPDGRIPFDDNRFDVVVSNQVFEHVPDLAAVVEEIHRVLRPGGVLLFLFPDRSIWREGHYGLPFQHRFRPGSRLRLWYSAACRALGFGYHHGGKQVWEWSHEACDWIDKWTYYRPYDQIAATFGKRFVRQQHHEAFWLDTRFAAGRPLVRSAPRALKISAVRKWAGMIGTVRKPGPDIASDRIQTVLDESQN